MSDPGILAARPGPSSNKGEPRGGAPGASTMDTRARKIRGMFSDIARSYDFLNHALSLNIDRLWRRRAVKATISPRPRAILDLCAGTGDLGLAYVDALRDGATVVGADFSRPMLKIGAQKAAVAGRGARMSFLEGDGMRLPFPDGSFDVTAVAFGLRNIVDWKQGIREMARVTRPGGRVAVLDFSIPRRQPMRALYLFYFLRVLPLIGNLVSRSRAYSYLPDSVLHWPKPEELEAMFEEAGLRIDAHRALSFGIAFLLVGVVR